MRPEMSKAKPIVVYLHRYPPEIEAFQWPALRELAEELAPAYELVYLCMGPAGGRRDAEIRRVVQDEWDEDMGKIDPQEANTTADQGERETDEADSQPEVSEA